jgi:hypothetical protein
MQSIQAYKVETVGDSYMTCGGIPSEDANHCEKLCHIALGFLWEARTTFGLSFLQYINVSFNPKSSKD